MSSENNQILLLGLPETGKTTFLAAFGYYLNADVSNKKLSEYKLSANTAYPNYIIQDWLKGKKLERTKITATKNKNTVVDIHLEDQSSRKKFTLHIPDFFGETFSNQFIDRLIEVEYLEQIKNASGIILFIHPEKIKLPVLIEDVAIAHKVEDNINTSLGASTEPVGGEISDGLERESVQQEIKGFDLEESPTQLILVDLLESHLEYLPSLPMKLVLVISAWDIVIRDAPDLAPAEWLKANLPLLYQFIYSNTEKISFSVFGISAQGGDLDDPAEKERLTGLNEPSERILVRDENSIHHNIASPIEWFLEQWQKTAL